jgi:hypothetical protein
MNTIIIFSDFQNSPVFFVVDGDYSHLNEVYINEATDNPELQDELSGLIDGLEALEDFPVDLFYQEYRENSESIKVITCGFIP